MLGLDKVCVCDDQPPSWYVIVSVSEVQQSCERIIQAAMETNYQHKVWVGIKVDLAICCVLNLNTYAENSFVTLFH